MKPTAQQIIERVVQLYDGNMEAFYSKSRERALVDQRAAVCYIFYNWMYMSSERIGRLICRDHATVLYHVRKAADWIAMPKINPMGATAINMIRREFFSGQ